MKRPANWPGRPSSSQFEWRRPLRWRRPGSLMRRPADRCPITGVTDRRAALLAAHLSPPGTDGRLHGLLSAPSGLPERPPPASMACLRVVEVHRAPEGAWELVEGGTKPTSAAVAAAATPATGRAPEPVMPKPEPRYNSLASMFLDCLQQDSQLNSAYEGERLQEGARQHAPVDHCCCFPASPPSLLPPPLAWLGFTRCAIRAPTRHEPQAVKWASPEARAPAAVAPSDAAAVPQQQQQQQQRLAAPGAAPSQPGGCLQAAEPLAAALALPGLPDGSGTDPEAVLLGASETQPDYPLSTSLQRRASQQQVPATPSSQQPHGSSDQQEQAAAGGRGGAEPMATAGASAGADAETPLLSPPAQPQRQGDTLADIQPQQLRFVPETAAEALPPATAHQPWACVPATAADALPPASEAQPWQAVPEAAAEAMPPSAARRRQRVRFAEPEPGAAHSAAAPAPAAAGPAAAAAAAQRPQFVPETAADALPPSQAAAPFVPESAADVLPPTQALGPHLLPPTQQCVLETEEEELPADPPELSDSLLEAAAAVPATASDELPAAATALPGCMLPAAAAAPETAAAPAPSEALPATAADALDAMQLPALPPGHIIPAAVQAPVPAPQLRPQPPQQQCLPAPPPAAQQAHAPPALPAAHMGAAGPAPAAQQGGYDGGLADFDVVVEAPAAALAAPAGKAGHVAVLWLASCCLG